MEKLYRYESTQRPVGLGTFPKRGAVETWNYGLGRGITHDENGNEIMSWGYIAYNRKLTEKEMSDYELTYSGEMDPEMLR